MPIKNVLKKVYLSSLKVIGNKGLGRMPIFKQINKKILKTIKSGSEPVFVNGFKMYLDKNDGSGFSLGTGYEKYETKVMKDHIKKGDIVIDCGGHIGYYSLLFSRLVGKKGKVYTFEADPTNFSLLKLAPVKLIILSLAQTPLYPFLPPEAYNPLEVEHIFKTCFAFS